MSKRVLCLMLSVIMLLLCACSEQMETETTRTNESTSDLLTNPTVLPTEMMEQPTESTTEPTFDPSTDETTIYTPQKLGVEIWDANNFSEGVAWVRYITPDGDYQTGILNKDGEIVTNKYILELDSIGSPFSGGFSYINTGTSFVIFDMNGNVTAQGPDDGDYEIVCGGDGVYLVYQRIKNFDTNEDRYGFIDGNGTWLLEPTTEHGFEFGKYVGGNSIMEFTYLEEHMFASCADSRIYTIWDVDGWRILQCEGDISIPDGVCFYNGVIIYSRNRSIYTLTASDEWTSNKIIEEWNPNYDYLYYSDGVVFHADGFDYIGAFYDIEGNIVLDLSERKLRFAGTPGFFKFENGIAAIKVAGADNETYITLIDKNGEFIIDPMKSYTLTGFGMNGRTNGAYSSGVIFVRSEEYGSVIVHSDGTMYDTEYTFLNLEEDEIVFCDGFAWDSKQRIFISDKGQILVPYIVQ